MSYSGFVVELKNVRPHPNADRMLLAECFGNTVCVGLDSENGQLGVYFPTDGQLSVEFCQVHDLVRRKNPTTGEHEGGYMDPDKRNVKTVKLRGELSDGLFMPISCLDYCFEDADAANHLTTGDTITVVNGHDICQKYIPRGKVRRSYGGGNKTRKRKIDISPLFAEHADTEQLAYNLDAFKPGDEVEITLKMHGTSQRTGYLPVFQKYKKSLLDIILRREGKPVYDWGYVSGTRRTVLEDFSGGFYGDNSFREAHSKHFEGKLQKGEEVFYEVVGYVGEGRSIMGTYNNSKINDKEFVKKYGDTTVFSYGCEEPNSDIYVYRMTMTNEDGFVVEYTPDFMRYRCEQMGVKCVPVFWKGIIPENPGTAEDDTVTAGEWIKAVAERYYAGTDPVGKTHIREGVVVRILNKAKFCAYKYKNVEFKILEGIYKETAAAPDMEEAQEINE